VHGNLPSALPIASPPGPRLTARLLTWVARAEALLRLRRVWLVLALLLVVYAARHVTRSMGDFKVYHRAAKRAVSGQTIYRLEDPHRYLYAPIVTFAFFPLAVLPSFAGKILWFLVNIAVIISILQSTAALLFRDGRAPPGFHLLVVLLSFRFIDNNLGHGQLNLVLLWLVLRAYRYASIGKYGLAGLALAAAIAAKIVPVVLLVQVLLRRQWRFALWTALGFAVLMLIPALWWGGAYPQLLRDWVTVLVDQAGHYKMDNKINQSIAAFTYRLFQPYPEGSPLIELSPNAVGAITWLLHGIFLVPLVLLSFRLAALRRPEPQGPNGDELSLYLLYSTVAAPYSWKYYFANLIFPLAGAARRLWGPERDKFAAGLGVVFALNLLAGLELLGKRLSTTFQLWSFHFLAVVVLFVLLARAAFRDTSRKDSSFTSSQSLC
jgi:alpha-1,2-mannosyltransferase